jgi:hypothetical protein
VSERDIEKEVAKKSLVISFSMLTMYEALNEHINHGKLKVLLKMDLFIIKFIYIVQH